MSRPDATDLLIVGAGAAGLFAAIAARGAVDGRGAPASPPADAPRVRVIDASARVGLKILVSGGGRCNVTNEVVDETDFDTDLPKVARSVLRGFPPSGIRTFLEQGGCPLYAEPLGKLFPTSDRARDVLRILVDAVERAGATLEPGVEVTAIDAGGNGFVASTAAGGAVHARRVVIATGGKSLPRTGSRGFGFEVAARSGHALSEVLPALTPLFLTSASPLAGLAGVTVPALLTLAPAEAPPEQIGGSRFRPLARAAGSLLVTHRGATGPAALDVSGACALALARGDAVRLRADFWSLATPDSPWARFHSLAKPPGACLRAIDTPRPIGLDAFVADARAIDGADRRALLNVLAARLPRSLAAALVARSGVEGDKSAAHLSTSEWRRVHVALAYADLELSGVDGFDKAEVTRGGVLLADLDRATLESRRRRGLHFCGEVAHCTGRLGGFNFQWAWSSGFAAGRGAARALAEA